MTSLFELDAAQVAYEESVNTQTETQEIKMSNKTKEQLFKVLVDLERELVSVQDAIKSTKEDFTHADDNPQGLDKGVVKEIAAFAKRYVNESVDKVIEQGELFKNLQDELVG